MSHTPRSTLATNVSPLFARRHNADGSHDTICRLCAATVASLRVESQLATAEAGHICDPVRLAYLAAGLPKSRRKPAIALDPAPGFPVHS
jgi:hypothetical protein